MGVDFTALIKYESFGQIAEQAVSTLESNSFPEAAEVGRLWLESGFSERTITKPVWVKHMCSLEEVARPQLPSLQSALRTGGEFDLAFGTDCLCVYHTLRWHFFLTEASWQHCMLKACLKFAALFNGSEGIVTADESPVIQGFLKGLSFDEALEQGKGAEGEVSRLGDLYEEI